MENLREPEAVQEPETQPGGRFSARIAKRGRSQDEQHHRGSSGAPPRKRKRTSTTSAPQIPEPMDEVPRSRQRFPIPESELPVASTPSPPVPEEPLLINYRPVEKFRRTYHSVVDDMLRFRDGRRRPYSLKLGRQIKKKLWEALDLPLIKTVDTEDGRLLVEKSINIRLCPPEFNVDVSGEPKPHNLPL